MSLPSLIILSLFLMCLVGVDCKGHGRGRASLGRRRLGGSSSSWFSTENSDSRRSISNWRNPANAQSNYKTLYSYPDRSSIMLKRYGTTFGNQGIGDNTFISNNYFKRPLTGGRLSFLTTALLHQTGMNQGHRSWSSEDDRKWRSTTKAPYFANKVPGSEKVLPAAAVIGENSESQ